jgi:hypothetical protein
VIIRSTPTALLSLAARIFWWACLSAALAGAVVATLEVHLAPFELVLDVDVLRAHVQLRPFRRPLLHAVLLGVPIWDQCYDFGNSLSENNWRKHCRVKIVPFYDKKEGSWHWFSRKKN